MSQVTRDLIGYGESPPHPTWPNEARLTINFVINFEEGAERCLLNGDQESENYLTEMAITPGWMSGEDFLVYLQNSVRCLYREGQQSPKMMTVALHARISGHPGRAEIIERFLAFVEQYPDIWLCTRQQIAAHWYRTHPFKTGV